MTVLVAAASKYGATAEIAEAIGRALREGGVAADVRPVEQAGDLAGYAGVVLGSAVYVGRWLEPGRRFVDEHAEELAAKPTWLFSSGPVGDPPKPGAAELLLALRVPEGDFRDWAEIAAWATMIAGAVSGEGSSDVR